MPYCPQCGSETEPEAAFCGDCGARLEEHAPPPGERPPTPRPAVGQGATPWSLLGAVIVLGALALGLVALYDAAANDGDWAESLFWGDGGEEAIVAAPSPTATAIDQLPPTVEPTPTEEPSPEPTVTPPSEEPTATPPASGYATPEEAIGAFLQERGLEYVGDCEGASLETDIGAYCSGLWEERFDSSIYSAGPTFSEMDTWLLLAQLSGRDDWTVVDFAPFSLTEEEPVPPWP